MSTLGHCLFCLESVQSTDNLDTTKTFLKFLQSYAQFDDLGHLLHELELTDIPPILILDCCEICQQNVDKFCEIYHKIKCLEIQLELKLDNLVNTIKQADKSSNKCQRSVDLFKNIFPNDEESKDKCDGMIRKFRENIQIGHHKLTESQQRVLQKAKSSIIPNSTVPVDIRANTVSDEISGISMETNDCLDDPGKCDDSHFNRVGIDTICSEHIVTPVVPAVPTTQLKLEREDITDDDHLDFPSTCQENLNDKTKHIDSQHQNLINQPLTSSKTSKNEGSPGNSGINTLNCVQCGRLFKSKKALERHTIYKHTERTLKCPHCKKKYHTQAELTRHNKFHTKPEEWKWQCKLCQKKFPFQQKLNKHLKTHVRAQSNPAEKSSEGEPLEVKTHHQKELPQPSISTKLHENEDVDLDFDYLKCDECGKKFKSKISLKQHKANSTSHSIRQFPCQHCDKKYHNNVMLNTHMVKCHKSEMTKWQCNNCDKKFGSECKLNEHMLTHTVS